MTEKADLILEIDAEIKWLYGSRPITSDCARDILILKSLKYLLEEKK
jgi:hypothetical protein